VEAVSSEPVSAEFPVLQGKYREFSRIGHVSALLASYKPLIWLLFSRKFPA